MTRRLRTDVPMEDVNSTSSLTPDPTAEVPAAPAGGTGVAVGGWSLASNRDIAITTINTNRTRIAEHRVRLDELEAVLVAAGLIPSA